MDREQMTFGQLQEESRNITRLRKANTLSKPRIAAWGLVKAGKSSLLNMLTGHAQQEHFKTGVVRTTRVNEALDLEHFTVLDTPGLDMDADDSRQAMKGLDHADAILFVHAPPGELDSEEIKLLMTLRDAYDDNLAERLIMVITCLDKQQSADMAKIRERIEQQVVLCLGFTPTVFEVSNTRFRKGVETDSQNLQAKSGIPALLRHLEKLSADLMQNLTQANDQRIASKAAAFALKIDQAISEEQTVLQALIKPLTHKAQALTNVISRLHASYGEAQTEINSAKAELRSI